MRYISHVEFKNDETKNSIVKNIIDRVTLGKEWDKSALEHEILEAICSDVDEYPQIELSQHETKSGHTETVDFDLDDFVITYEECDDE